MDKHDSTLPYTLRLDDSCCGMPRSGREEILIHLGNYNKAMKAHGFPEAGGDICVTCQPPSTDAQIVNAPIHIPEYRVDKNYRIFVASVAKNGSVLFCSTLVIAEDDVCVYSTYEVISYGLRRDIPAELWYQVDMAIRDIKSSWDHCRISLPEDSPYAPAFYSVAAGPLPSDQQYPVDSREVEFLRLQTLLGGELRKISVQSNGAQMGYALLHWRKDESGKMRHRISLTFKLPPEEILARVGGN